MFVVPSFFGFQFANSGGGGFDPDYQAVINYATLQGYTLPSASQQLLQNQLVVDLKAGGVWNKLDTLGVLATDGNSDFALIDWIRLTQYTAINSPTFSANGGFTGNGTSSYIDTNFNPATQGVNYTLNNASRFYWVDNNVTGICEGILLATRNDSRLSTSGQQRINQGTSQMSFTTAFNKVGLHAINRFSSADINIFINTTSNPNSSNSVSIESQNQLILRGGNNYNASRFRFYGMGASLVSQNTALYNALNNYLTNI